MEQINSVAEFMEHFNEEQTCLDYLTGIRFRNGMYCPYCFSNRIYKFQDRKTYKCAECLQKFTVKTGTIFENTKVPLTKWLLAIFLLSTAGDGIASTALAGKLGVTQKTVLFMYRRIENAYRQNKREFTAGKSATPAFRGDSL